MFGNTDYGVIFCFRVPVRCLDIIPNLVRVAVIPDTFFFVRRNIIAFAHDHAKNKMSKNRSKLNND